MKRIILAVLVIAMPAHADAPYALGWALRPAAPANVLRSDTSIGFFDEAGTSGSTVASTFLVSYKLTPALSPLVRFAVIHDAPAGGESATAMSNPLIGATWAPLRLSPPFKLALFGGLALPLGSGGGNDADPMMTTTVRSAVAARSSMDNALFAINDLTPIVGVDAAYVAGGLTVQIEATLFELFRMRGDEVQADAYKTNFTTGFQIGCFIAPWLSTSTELRYQRWLSTPTAVKMDMTGASRDTLSGAIGLRGHIPLGPQRWLRPGVSYARGLDDPLTGRNYQVIQVDVPFAF
jgi:hypothetical protein